MINQVTLVGRLTKDPELREVANGKHVLSVVVAVNRPFKNQSGENETDFVRCIIWNRIAETTTKYCSKGSLVGVTGRIQTRSYERDGKRQYSTEVIAESVQFLEPKRPSFTPHESSTEAPTKMESFHVETIK